MPFGVRIYKSFEKVPSNMYLYTFTWPYHQFTFRLSDYFNIYHFKTKRMKKLLFLAAICLIGTQAQSQWKTTGNAGTVPGTNFLGTTDAKALYFKTNNTTKLAITTAGNIGIGTTSPATRLHVTNTSLSGIGTTGSFLIGATNNYNLVMDNNEIQSRFNGASSTLYLQYWGGDINACATGGSANFNGPVNIQSSNLTVGGRIGVGGTPSYDLDVKSTDYSAAYISSPYNGGTAFNVIASGTTQGTWGIYSYATTVGYAAYFSGNIYCSGSYLPSDERLKENIAPLQNALERIMKLEVKTYNFKSSLDKMNLPTEKQYGYLAQNLELYFPELVRLNPAKKEQPLEFKAVNYLGMIPVLTEAIQEQQKQIEAKDKAIIDLQNQLNEIKLSVQTLSENSQLKSSSTASINKNTRLFQNQPNPFNQTTIIRYVISEEHNNCLMVIRDLNGNLVKSFSLNNSGEGQITINGAELTSGTYTYSIVTETETLDTKLMVITR